MTDLSLLRSRLVEIDRLSSEQWLGTLEDRKKKELEFHDLDRTRSRREELDPQTHEEFYGNRKYYRATAPSSEFVQSWIRNNAKDKVFLDYACGDGGSAIAAAKAGAALAIGLDISSVSVQNARAQAVQAGVAGNTFFVQADAENTGLPSKSVDAIICSGVLHHLDLSFAFPEIRRILAPGGKVLAGEALNYNPAIKLYRKLTPKMRTEWEAAHILSLKDVRFAQRFFDLEAVRYWHVVAILGGRLPGLLPLLHVCDQVLTKIPLVQLMAWIFTIELVSKERVDPLSADTR